VTGGVEEGDGRTEIDAVPVMVKEIDPVEVKDPVTELVREMDIDPVGDTVLVAVGV
jgi:hypothetical protein